MAASHKVASEDSKNLSSDIWKILPKELLLLVFARLPVPDITRLRSLSKEWNRDMATVNSETNQAFDETSPTRVVVISSGSGIRFQNKFLVTICKRGSQYSYCLRPGNPDIHEDGWDNMGARHGGLVCFVSTWRPSKANPLCIVVVNLLTQVWRKLPPLQHAYVKPPQRMHIEVDSETKCYRVVVVGETTKGRPTIEIYDSSTRQWTEATPPLGFIFGSPYRWKYDTLFRTFTSYYSTIGSVYDFVEGQLRQYDQEGILRGASVMSYALQKDCMFELHKTDTSKGDILPTGGYCITKYRIQNNAKDWVQGRSYLCTPFEALLEKEKEKDNFWMALKACEDFLMVIMYPSSVRNPFRLLDLSTREWSKLPICFEEHKYETLLSRASWNVVP